MRKEDSAVWLHSCLSHLFSKLLQRLAGEKKGDCIVQLGCGEQVENIR